LTSYKLCLFAYRRDFLSSKTTAENEEYAGKADVSKFGGKVSDCIKETREEYGRYFGICGSYHHLKACICRICPSYSSGAGMFCSRSKNRKPGKKEGCLCESCELFRKFRFEGDYFCREEEKPEYSEKPGISLNNYKNNSIGNGKTRVCVLEKMECTDK
jgi:hypothetical protein